MVSEHTFALQKKNLSHNISKEKFLEQKYMSLYIIAEYCTYTYKYVHISNRVNTYCLCVLHRSKTREGKKDLKFKNINKYFHKYKLIFFCVVIGYSYV